MIAALLLAAAAHWPGAAQAEQQIRAQRAAFNRAIASGDIPAIASVLADNAQLIGGDFSTLTAGKQAQVALWAHDLTQKSRGIYVRTPDRITLSPLLPMAMESGHWRGVDSKSRKEWASGIYAAKWRRFGGTWKVETETYMTIACGGDWCPKARQVAAERGKRFRDEGGKIQVPALLNACASDFRGDVQLINSVIRPAEEERRSVRRTLASL